MTSWLKLTIAIRSSSEVGEEEMVACLHEGGTIGVESRDGRLMAYFPETIDEAALLRQLGPCLGRAESGAELLGREIVADGFWHERWMESLQPFALGERFLIAPGLARPRQDPGRSVIRLTPGRAFGTGEHPTTRMCVELLERTISAGDRLLDVGTGSGILAIAGRLLGAGDVCAIDTDETAVMVAARNARDNGALGIHFVVAGPEAIAMTHADVIVANLTGATLLALLPSLTRLRPRAAILSGILREEESEVVAAGQEAGLAARERLIDGDWVALTLEQA